jgi:Arc/MetJ-type ribon-helix-helix transcriptional regulator
MKTRELMPITIAVKITKQKNRHLEELALKHEASKSDVIRNAINLMLETNLV